MKPVRLARCAAALLLLLLSLLCALAPAAPSSPHWVSTWIAVPDGAGPVLKAQTIRQIVRTSIGGSAVRVRLSNLYGSAPLTIGSAHVALRAGGAAIEPGSDHVLTFGGRPATIAQGESIVSDPVRHADAGSALVADAGGTMDDIVASVGRVTGIMGEITAARPRTCTASPARARKSNPRAASHPACSPASART